jgi:hypothetical protein
MFSLQPPRHIPTLPFAPEPSRGAGRLGPVFSEPNIARRHRPPDVMCHRRRGSIPHPMQSLCSFAVTVASGHAKLATKRTLLLTWPDLHRLDRTSFRLAHLFDYFIRSDEN